MLVARFVNTEGMVNTSENHTKKCTYKPNNPLIPWTVFFKCVEENAWKYYSLADAEERQAALAVPPGTLSGWVRGT